MAVVDTNTGRIVGAKEGTPIWWHEKGHIEFSKTNTYIKNQVHEWISLRLCVLFIVLSLLFDSNPFVKWVAFAFILLVIFYYVYEEAWAWNYANTQMKGGKNNGVQKKES